MSHQPLLIDRRTVLAGALSLASTGWPAVAQEAPEAGFTFETVARLAQDAAAEPYAPSRLDLVPPFDDLSYDAYRAIRFRPEARLWLGGERGFRLDMLPPGLFYEDRVDIALVSGGLVTPLAFDPALFDFHPDYFDQAPAADETRDLGYSGFRLRAPINQPEVWDEFLVFQGASYFRGVGRDQLYGLSARGLALGVGAPEGEEFPLFRRFWIHNPEPGATAVRIHALLDSPSIAGAYEFLARPGAETIVETRAALYPRREIAELGIAPLTSMYFFSPKSRVGVDDYRDAVHDSGGLQMVAGRGERLWRPLDNPPTLQFSVFSDENPQGFGLVQRHRDFAWYEDAEARYEKRPSAWIAPTSDWGRGAVVLVEIPTDSEFNDNVVAYWRPEEPLPEGGELRLGYRIHWGDAPPDEAPLARVAATRGGTAVNAPERRTYVIDFELGEIAFDGLTVEASTSAGRIVSVVLMHSPREGVARAAIEFDPEAADLAELRLELVGPDGAAASETWLSRWTRR